MAGLGHGSTWENIKTTGPGVDRKVCESKPLAHGGAGVRTIEGYHCCNPLSNNRVVEVRCQVRSRNSVEQGPVNLGVPSTGYSYRGAIVFAVVFRVGCLFSGRTTRPLLNPNGLGPQLV